jgi:hypothetical protein
MTHKLRYATKEIIKTLTKLTQTFSFRVKVSELSSADLSFDVHHRARPVEALGKTASGMR